MRASKTNRMAVLLCTAVLLTACEEGFAPLTPEAEAAAPVEAAPTEFIERDVEAPEVFSANESGLWDGRPSLGGIWVAYPDVASPERVLIRNINSGDEVVGALFRREREMPGPAIQVSSEAASALGMLAGQPAPLSVVALQRERIPVLPPEPPPSPEPEVSDEDDSTAEATAAAALAAVAATPSIRPTPRPVRAAPAEPETPTVAALPPPVEVPEAEASAATETAVTTAPLAPPASSPDRAYLQIGIFAVEANAQNTAESLRLAGIIPTVRTQTSGGKDYWRVVVGPVTSLSERSALLSTVRDLGYTDAYAVTN